MEQRPEAKDIAGDDADASSARVLIVDDMPSNVALLADALGDDYELYFATSGEQALETAVTKRVDLILLDIMMPEVDGYEVCRLLQLDARLAEIPVIFVTAKSSLDDELEGFAAGGVDYITKPISPPLVQARVRTHLELKAARDRLRALSSIDGLTGLPNRPAFDATLERELRRTQFEAGPLTVLLLGLDQFREVNAAHGHLAADRVLQRVAQSLAAPGGPAATLELVARYGGDRFGLICPDTDYAAAQVRARELLGHLAALEIPGPGVALTQVTASIGGVTLAPPWPRLPDAAAVLRRAEALLAEAKRSGHNQFWVEREGAAA
jgi:diguanylate cyclase (GGDEF)-like protein